MGGSARLVNAAPHPPDSVAGLNAPITTLGGDENILGRFYDITQRKDGWDHCSGSAGNRGVAVNLFMLIFSHESSTE